MVIVRASSGFGSRIGQIKDIAIRHLLQRELGSESGECVSVERLVHSRTVKNPIKRVGLVQSGNYHHRIDI